MANKHRCEVPFPKTGEGHFIRFDLNDLITLEDEFGSVFFDDIEQGAREQSPSTIIKCLKIGLKKKDDAGNDVVVWDGLDQNKLQDEGFSVGDAGIPILEALSLSWLNKTYDVLIKEAEAAKKTRETEQAEQIKSAVTTAAGAAKEAGIPFDGEASLKALLSMLTNQGLNPLTSGN